MIALNDRTRLTVLPLLVIFCIYLDLLRSAYLYTPSFTKSSFYNKISTKIK